MVTAALTANALYPLPGFRGGALAFIPGWLAGELAPHLLATTLADTAVSAARGRASRTGLVVAGATAVGLASLIEQSRHVETMVSTALEEGLGPGYAEQLDPAPPDDLPTAWRAPGQPVPGARRRGPGRPRHRLHRRGAAGHARHLPSGGPRPDGRTGAAPGPRRWMDGRAQGPAGRPVDAADGRAAAGSWWRSTTASRRATTTPRRSST